MMKRERESDLRSGETVLGDRVAVVSLAQLYGVRNVRLGVDWTVGDRMVDNW